MEDSIFTKIIKHEIPAKIMFDDSDIIAVGDIDPQAPVHILIIPKQQIPTLNDLDEKDALLMGKIILTAKKLAKEYSIDERGYRLVLNCNEEAGQTVFHIHCHLLGGRPMHWPPG
jgi:histidine triad (HIT) family protein